MCIILILEIVSTSVFLTYKDTLVSKSKLNDTVNAINKNNDTIAFNVMNILQTAFKCCGCDGPADYFQNVTMESCKSDESKPDKPLLYQTGI